jgi:pimeloyl-ACP methyl ester carboxylesterase
MGQTVGVNGTEIRVEQRGDGPDVLLIAGLSDPAEAWQPQLDGLSDRYRVTAFANRGAGQTPLPDDPLTVEMMADDAAAILAALDVPELVRSLLLQSTWAKPDAYFQSMGRFWRWMVENAPSERAMLEAFFLWVYTPRAHADGMVDEITDEALADPHPQSVEAFQAQLNSFFDHETLDRLPAITAPTLVLAGGVDIGAPPRLGKVVADAIPGAQFEVLEGEAHQPFQEVPDVWNARADAFWREVEARL